MKLTFIAAAVVYSAACVAAPSPYKVESRRAATKPWTSYEAFSIDRIPGFTPSPDPALDEYGGWLGTHVGNPDGFFRVRKINGRWWMVDPAGNLFLAKAVAGFKPGAGWLVHTQDERGIFYQNFVNELIKGGACVGWHWFKYGDNDPTDPRNDPSNRDSNKGMVTWDFRRYEPLADRMREINNCTYNLSRFHEKFSRISSGGRDL